MHRTSSGAFSYDVRILKAARFQKACFILTLGFLFPIAKMSSAARGFSLKKIAETRLGVSEPNPSWFGNPVNEGSNPLWTNSNWLKSRFHFSFAEYSNRHNQNFGVLRVMNDDLVQPARGFGEHPHKDVEICT
jgi:hypothetical protein